MTLTKADRVASLFNELGWHNRKAGDVVDLCVEEKRASLRVDEASNDWDKSEGWGLMGKRALNHCALSNQGEFSRGRVKTVCIDVAISPSGRV